MGESPIIDRAKRLILLAKKEDPTMIIEESHKSIWNVQHEILNKNETFFTDTFTINTINNTMNNDQKQLFDSIFTMMKILLGKLNAGEKAYIWTRLAKLVEYTVEYMLLTGKFEKK